MDQPRAVHRQLATYKVSQKHVSPTEESTRCADFASAKGESEKCITSRRSSMFRTSRVGRSLTFLLGLTGEEGNKGLFVIHGSVPRLTERKKRKKRTLIFNRQY